MSKKFINRITHIQYKSGVSPEELNDSEWILNSDSSSADDNISIYEHIDDDGEVEVCAWTYERFGKRHCFESGNSLFENISDIVSNFFGNKFMSVRILQLGWLCWEDEIEIKSNEKLLEGIGADYSGELNLSAIKKKLEKIPDRNLAVFRTVYTGEAEISFSDIESTSLYTPESFESDDELEAVRFVYVTKL